MIFGEISQRKEKKILHQADNLKKRTLFLGFSRFINNFARKQRYN